MFDLKPIYQDPVTATIVLGGIAAAATVVSIDQSQQAAKSQSKARKVDQRRREVQSGRERRKQIQAAQVAQAEIAATGIATGTTTTSGITQASTSVQSQLASNISFLNVQEGLANRQSIFLQKAADFQSNAATASAVAGLAGSGASLFSAPASKPAAKPATT